MPAFPNMIGAVFFGDPAEESLPDWRQYRDAHEADDDEDKSLTDTERSILAGKLGFDPGELEEEDNTPVIGKSLAADILASSAAWDAVVTKLYGGKAVETAGPYVAIAAGLDEEKAFDESKHPRGQPGNPGQFGPGSGAEPDNKRPIAAEPPKNPISTRADNSAWLSTLPKEVDRVLGNWCAGDVDSIRDAEAAGVETDKTRLWKAAIDAAPEFVGIAYRGVSIDEESPLYQALSGGGTVILNASSSASKQAKWADLFAKTTTGFVKRKPVVMEFTTKGASDISAKGNKIYGDQDEVILRRSTSYRVVSKSKSQAGFEMFHLEEI